MTDPHAHLEKQKIHRLTAVVPAAVITVSERCASGHGTDESGPLAVELLGDYGLDVREHSCVRDGQHTVRQALSEALARGARVIVTTGGTGISSRDQTPEATAGFLSAQLPGVATQILMQGLKSTPLAGLSRGLVGITGHGAHGALIINAPGSTSGVRDTLEVVGPLIAHIMEQIDPEGCGPTP